MAIKKMFSVYDSKSLAFLTPLVFDTHGQAERAFLSAVMDQGHDFAKWAEDYCLYELGEWDDSNGLFSCLDAPKALLNAAHAKALAAEMKKGAE